MDYFIRNGELYHWGVVGMKWGVRRYQNADGSLTEAGKKRLAKKEAAADKKLTKKQDKMIAKAEKKVLKEADESKKEKKSKDTSSHRSVKNMSDDELQAAIRRLEMEKRYKDLNPKQVSMGEKFFKEAVMPAVTQSGKQLMQDVLIKKGKEYLGLNEKSNDYIGDLKKAVEKLNLEKQFKDLTTPKVKTDLELLKDEVTEMQLRKALEKLREEETKKS